MKIRISAIIFAFIIFMIPKRAFAYIDPGSGSFFFQALIAFAVGGLFAIKMHWRKIINKFKKDEENE